MNFHFRKLTQKNALIIANEWKYNDEYAFYDMTADEEDYQEFTNKELRGNNYYEAFSNNELVGFFCIEITNEYYEIGLGLKPDLCGKGLGKSFVLSIINKINKDYPHKKQIIQVATFNKRAIKTYEACGFVEKDIFIQDTNGGQYEFIKMIKN